MIKPLKWLSYFFVAVIIIVGLLLASLSWTVPALVDQFLQEKGYAIDFQKVRINPFRGSATFSGVTLSNKQATELSQQIRLRRFSTKIQPLALLLDRHVVIDPLTLDGLDLTVHKTAQGFRVGGFPHELLQASTEEDSPTQDQEVSSDQAVSFRVENLSLTNINISIQDKARPDGQMDLKIGVFSINDIDSLSKAQNSRVKAELELDDIALSAHGDVAPLAQPLTADLSVALNQLDSQTVFNAVKFLPDNEALLAALEPLLYKADLSSDIQLALNDEPSFTINNFELDIAESAYWLKDESPATKAQKLDFAGRISAEKLSSNGSAAYVINKLQIDDGNIGFTGNAEASEKTSSEVAQADITLSNLQFEVDQASHPDVSTSLFKLNSEVGQFGKLDASGSVTAADFGQSTQVTLKGEQLDLVPLSNTVRQILDRGIKSGLLSIDSEVSIESRQLTASNALRIDQLKLSGVGKTAEGESSDALKLGMPLNTALSLLKDKNDRIELDLPVSGSIDNPEFGLASVIQVALAKSITSAVTTKVGPLLALSALSKARDLGDALKLKPVVFEAGSTAISDEGSERIAKLAAFLEQRQAVSITVCPYAVVADASTGGAANAEAKEKPTLNSAQKAISEQRLDVIKSTLLAKGIDGQRIVPCATELDTGPEAKPRVSFSF